MEEDKNTINVIKFVLAKKPTVQFKQCTKCKRELPCDDLFYNKHPKGRYGYDTKCKECSNIKYKFEIPYNGDSIEQVYSNYRKMSSTQIQKFYNKKSDTISIFLKSNGYNVSKKYIINNLSKDEVIFLYDSLLNGENKSLTNGILKNNNSFKYLSYILEYVFIEKLKCKTKKDICNILSSSLLKKYSMQGLMATMNLKIIDILNILNKIYNLDIKLWEIKSSSVGNNFWSNKSNIEEVLIWIRNKLKDGYNINNIYESESFGFTKIIEELSLTSLYGVYDGVYVLFEDIFKTKFNPEMCLEKFTFNKNTQLNVCSNDSLIYTISEDYYKLDENGKTLINEVIRFCQKENKFPSEKDLSKKNGYIARTQFYKYGKSNNINWIYNYIEKIEEQEKPKLMKCIKCGEIKEFNKNNFAIGKRMKFGLKHQCKDCEALDRQISNYRNKGILFDKITDIKPIEWWEYNFNKKINIMPKFCYDINNLIEIIRYILINKLGYDSKEKIIINFKSEIIEKYLLNSIVYKLEGKLKTLQLCFPEYDFSENDFIIYDENIINNKITKFLYDNNFNIQDILDCKIKPSKEIINIIAWTRNNINIDSFQELMIWFFKNNNIKHPKYQIEINFSHFKNKIKKYYTFKTNRINETKKYCENIVGESILLVISDTEKLKQWAYKYFKLEDVQNNSLNHKKYYNSLYDMLIEAYPCIKENHIMFKWEWHQTNENDREFLIQMLREFVLFRMNDTIKNIELELPKYLNMSYFDVVFPKMNKHIDKKRFKNYYEWACLSFPEYKNKWDLSDFGKIASMDGNIFDSFQERDIYEYIKSKNIFKYIKSIGKLKGNHKYSFEATNNEECNRYCPDFIIEFILDQQNNKVVLKKPIVLEYYGLYDEFRNDHIFKKYRDKTKFKEEFYKNNKDIYYIGIFPDDIKNNFEGLAKKLSLFCMENFKEMS